MKSCTRSAFTIVEMLVVISVIALLMAILLPAVNGARDQAKVTQSKSNLKQIGTALQTYSSEWSERHLTYVKDDIQTYGADPVSAAAAYFAQHSEDLPGIPLGWATRQSVDTYGLFQFHMTATFGTQAMMVPMNFTDTASVSAGFGWFRLINAKGLHDYMGERFYDPIYYAPKDERVMEFAEPGFEWPEEYLPTGIEGGNQLSGIAWSSYIFSPAALFAPAVMRSEGDGGWQDPWSLPAGFRVPSVSQAEYSSLKTHVMEHHWLQNKRGRACNPAFASIGIYDGCEPYYFNANAESSPITLFYDGHIDTIGVGAAHRADGQAFAQSGEGLWLRSTPLGDDGYFIPSGYDYDPDNPNFASTSFHILTTDGIAGRDIVAD